MTPWYEDEKERFNTWEYRELVEQIKNAGWDLSTFLHQAMLLYLGLEDPREIHKQETMDKLVPELKKLRPISVKNQSSGSGAGAFKNGKNVPELSELRVQELQALGLSLSMHPQCAAILRDLKRKDPDDQVWEQVHQDLSQNGFPYDPVELWNNALEWWKTFKSS
jgi:hypothetical protein